jgi:hypothetical protein
MESFMANMEAKLGRGKKTNGIRKGMFTNKLLSMQSPFSLANFGAFTVSKAGCDN